METLWKHLTNLKIIVLIKFTIKALGICTIIHQSFAEPPIHVPEPVRFYQYFTAENYKEICHDGIQSHLQTAKVKPTEPTFLIIDGFLSSFKSNMTQNVKNTILLSRQKRNVIVVDWSELSGYTEMDETMGLNGSYSDIMLVYNVARTKVDLVGRKVAKFLVSLIDANKTGVLRLHLVGYSLGAHIAGIVGQIILKKYGERIMRITGCDPAGPGFPVSNLADRLDSTDAEFVDIFHTNRLIVGDVSHAVGHVDVYVNGGTQQPGCVFKSFVQKTTCNHQFSWKIWNHCMKSSCMACRCQSDECKDADTNGGCNTEFTTVGMNVSLDEKGEFYLKTGLMN